MFFKELWQSLLLLIIHYMTTHTNLAFNEPKGNIYSISSAHIAWNLSLWRTGWTIHHTSDISRIASNPMHRNITKHHKLSPDFFTQLIYKCGTIQKVTISQVYSLRRQNVNSVILIPVTQEITKTETPTL